MSHDLHAWEWRRIVTVMHCLLLLLLLFFFDSDSDSVFVMLVLGRIGRGSAGFIFMGWRCIAGVPYILHQRVGAWHGMGWIRGVSYVRVEG